VNSNHEFYEDQLYIVPSPFELNPELGLKLHFVEVEGVLRHGFRGGIFLI
jgi:hypothetical protein